MSTTINGMKFHLDDRKQISSASNGDWFNAFLINRQLYVKNRNFREIFVIFLRILAIVKKSQCCQTNMSLTSPYFKYIRNEERNILQYIIFYCLLCISQ